MITFQGTSILHDPISFFKPVSEWVETYIGSPADQTSVILKFEYLDTASVQAIFDILKRLKKIPGAGNRLHISWYFEFDDPELLEIGEIMETRLRIKFDFIEYQKDDPRD